MVTTVQREEEACTMNLTNKELDGCVTVRPLEDGRVEDTGRGRTALPLLMMITLNLADDNGWPVGTRMQQHFATQVPT